MYYRIYIFVSLLGICLLGLSSCASVPEETVRLSYAVGQDIQELHNGYRRTVVLSFEHIRQRGLTVIKERWTPIYLKNHVKKSGLFEHLQNKEVPEAERYGDLEFWARGAIEDIDNKRKKFLDPLKKREDALLADLDNAFGRVIRANAQVTANLNTVLKVQNLQDDILESVGLKDVRDKINNGIVEASNFAAKATKEIEDASKKLQDATEKGDTHKGEASKVEPPE